MVMGVDSRSKGRGFESQRRILDGHFFTLICCKNCIVCLKKTENKQKRGRGWPNKKKEKLLKLLFSRMFCFSNEYFAAFLQSHLKFWQIPNFSIAIKKSFMTLAPEELKITFKTQV